MPKIHTAPRAAAALLALAAALAFAARGASAQISGAIAPVGGAGGQHEIYGEFKVDESKANEKVPGSFVLVLQTDAGKVIERQPAMPNSTFRFMGLRNGTYQIVVESAGMPVAQVKLMINSSRKTEARQNIELEWVGSPTSGAKPASVSAAEFYERPAANRPLFEQAVAAVKKKKHADAVALLRQVVEADAKDHIAWAHLGAAHAALKETAESERSYRRALELRPDQLTAAVEVLKPAVEKHPHSADAAFLLAESYLQTGKFQESAALFAESLRLDPKGKAEAHLRLAALLDASGQKEKAAAELQQFVAKQPNHPNREKFDEYIRLHRKR